MKRILVISILIVLVFVSGCGERSIEDMVSPELRDRINTNPQYEIKTLYLCMEDLEIGANVTHIEVENLNEVIPKDRNCWYMFEIPIKYWYDGDCLNNPKNCEDTIKKSKVSIIEENSYA